LNKNGGVIGSYKKRSDCTMIKTKETNKEGKLDLNWGMCGNFVECIYWGINIPQ
jgi:hypothetical protein